MMVLWFLSGCGYVGAKVSWGNSHFHITGQVLRDKSIILTWTVSSVLGLAIYLNIVKTTWMGKINSLQISKQFEFLHPEYQKHTTLLTFNTLWLPFKFVCNEKSSWPNKTPIVNFMNVWGWQIFESNERGNECLTGLLNIYIQEVQHLVYVIHFQHAVHIGSAHLWVCVHMCAYLPITMSSSHRSLWLISYQHAITPSTFHLFREILIDLISLIIDHNLLPNDRAVWGSLNPDHYHLTDGLCQYALALGMHCYVHSYTLIRWSSTHLHPGFSNYS